MKAIKKILCLMLAVLTVCSLCACGSGSSGSHEETPEQKVRAAVEARGRLEYIGSTIGGKELKSSRVIITNVKRVTDGIYVVSGKIIMTDIYGTEWNNTFDCDVNRKPGDTWEAYEFEYTSKNWTKE